MSSSGMDLSICSDMLHQDEDTLETGVDSVGSDTLRAGMRVCEIPPMFVGAIRGGVAPATVSTTPTSELKTEGDVLQRSWIILRGICRGKEDGEGAVVSAATDSRLRNMRPKRFGNTCGCSWVAFRRPHIPPVSD